VAIKANMKESKSNNIQNSSALFVWLQATNTVNDAELIIHTLEQRFSMLLDISALERMCAEQKTTGSYWEFFAAFVSQLHDCHSEDQIVCQVYTFLNQATASIQSSEISCFFYNTFLLKPMLHNSAWDAHPQQDGYLEKMVTGTLGMHPGGTFEGFLVRGQDAKQSYEFCLMDDLFQKGYELCLIEELPKTALPTRGKIYLEKSGNQLKYTVHDPTNGKVATGKLDLDIGISDLTKEILNRHKNDILSTILRNGHILSTKHPQNYYAPPEPGKIYFKNHGDWLSYIVETPTGKARYRGGTIKLSDLGIAWEPFEAMEPSQSLEQLNAKKEPILQKISRENKDDIQQQTDSRQIPQLASPQALQQELFESLRILDMLRYAAYCNAILKKKVAVYRSVDLLAISSTWSSSDYLLIDFNIKQDTLPKWGVFDCKNCKVYCEISLTEKEKSCFERNLSPDDMLHRIEYTTNPASGNNHSTGFFAVNQLKDLIVSDNSVEQTFFALRENFLRDITHTNKQEYAIKITDKAMPRIDAYQGFCDKLRHENGWKNESIITSCYEKEFQQKVQLYFPVDQNNVIEILATLGRVYSINKIVSLYHTKDTPKALFHFDGRVPIAYLMSQATKQGVACMASFMLEKNYLTINEQSSQYKFSYPQGVIVKKIEKAKISVQDKQDVVAGKLLLYIEKSAKGKNSLGFCKNGEYQEIDISSMGNIDFGEIKEKSRCYYAHDPPRNELIKLAQDNKSQHIATINNRSLLLAFETMLKEKEKHYFTMLLYIGERIESEHTDARDPMPELLKQYLHTKNLDKIPPSRLPSEGELTVLMILTALHFQHKKRNFIVQEAPSYIEIKNEHIDEIVLFTHMFNPYLINFQNQAAHPALITLQKRMLPIMARNRWLQFNSYKPPLVDNFWQEAAKQWMRHYCEHDDVLRATHANNTFRQTLTDTGRKGFVALMDYLQSDAETIKEQLGTKQLTFYIPAVQEDIETHCYQRRFTEYAVAAIRKHIDADHYFPFNQIAVSCNYGKNAEYGVHEKNFIADVFGPLFINSLEKILLVDVLEADIDAMVYLLTQLAEYTLAENIQQLIVIPELDNESTILPAHKSLVILYRHLNNIILNNRRNVKGELQCKILTPLAHKPKQKQRQQFTKTQEKEAIDIAVPRNRETLLQSWPVRHKGNVQLQMQLQQQLHQQVQQQIHYQTQPHYDLDDVLPDDLITYHNIEEKLGDYYNDLCKNHSVSSEKNLQQQFRQWVSAPPNVTAKHVIHWISPEAAKALIRKPRGLHSGLNPENLPRGFYTQRTKDDELVLLYNPEKGYLTTPNPLTLNFNVVVPQAEVWQGDFRQFDLQYYLKKIPKIAPSTITSDRKKKQALASYPYQFEAVDFQYLTLFATLQPRGNIETACDQLLKENPTLQLSSDEVQAML
jgi:hypothetical protein